MVSAQHGLVRGLTILYFDGRSEVEFNERLVFDDDEEKVKEILESVCLKEEVIYSRRVCERF